MSSIFGLITDNCAFVVSEGQTTTATGDFAEGNFDKTFKLDNGNVKLIGAFVGKMRFQGKRVNEHFREIVTSDCANLQNFADSLECIVTTFKNRLMAIDNNEMAFEQRVVDLIIIGSYDGQATNFKIYNFRFKPNIQTNDIEIVKSETPTHSPHANIVYWSIWGDDSAKDAIGSYLNRTIPTLSVFNKDSLESICTPAMQEGIKNCAINDKGVASCGGEIFIKQLP